MSVEKYAILAVDDEPTNHIALRNILQDDYTLYTASSGSEALLMVGFMKPDLILLDLLMPEMDGFEVLGRLKSDPETAEVPVIILSALSGADNRKACFALGAAEYISKPFNSETVRARVETHIRIARHASSLIRWGLADKLTGTAGKEAFDERIAEEWKRAASDKKPLSLLMVDLDMFQVYNDTYGTAMGDMVLCAASRICCAAAMRPSDLVARIGGEEFAVLLPSSGMREAIRVAEAIRSGIESAVVPNKRFGDTSITASVGIASITPSELTTVEDFITEANSYLYTAKVSGRNRVCSAETLSSDEPKVVSDGKRAVRRHFFVINPKSFENKPRTLSDIKRRINEYFEKTGEECDIYTTLYSRDAISEIRRFMKDVPREVIVRVYAVGGDGILFDCLNGIVGLPNAELAPIPYGSQNSFVRSFGPNAKAIFRDIAKVATAPTILTDLMKCDGNYGINNCCIGIEAAATMKGYELSKAMSWLGRFWTSGMRTRAFTLGGIAALFNRDMLRQRYNGRVDDSDFDARYCAINIANAQYYGDNLCANAGAMPTDGQINILFFKTATTLRAISTMPGYLRGGWRKMANRFAYRKGTYIKVESPKPLTVVLDGEIFYDDAISVELIPAAVRIAVPGGLSYEGGKGV
ncbi:hypothetical protein FACS1894208_03570 [Clostridia bacterium]|nr:hypothetical protein FACS1894208_03570 [Clostridia bacterium]